MTHSENFYRQDVFLQDLRNNENRHDQRIWSEHQYMQLSFLQSRGLTSSSVVLDIGCGPMRLGSALIPLLNKGWYFGQDINPQTIQYGEEVLREKVSLCTHLIHSSLLITSIFTLSTVLFISLSLTLSLVILRSILSSPPFSNFEPFSHLQVYFMPPFLILSPVFPGCRLTHAISGDAILRPSLIRILTIILFQC